MIERSNLVPLVLIRYLPFFESVPLIHPYPQTLMISLVFSACCPLPSSCCSILLTALNAILQHVFDTAIERLMQEVRSVSHRRKIIRKFNRKGNLVCHQQIFYYILW